MDPIYILLIRIKSLIDLNMFIYAICLIKTLLIAEMKISASCLAKTLKIDIENGSNPL